MKIDESKSTTTQADCEGDRQNRREFFNGLGKWSMIVVAAVSFLRGSSTRAPKPATRTSQNLNRPLKGPRGQCRMTATSNCE